MNSATEKTLEKVHDIFTSRQLSLSVAESCTGGLISHYITSLPGASAFFNAGIVSYAGTAKKDILKIPGEILHTFGMVSEETAKAMAEQVRIIADSDYSIATTGNLGPDVLEGKNTGLIYIAVSKKGKTVSKKLHLNGSRAENKEDAASAALNLLIDFVDSNE